MNAEPVDVVGQYFSRVRARDLGMLDLFHDDAQLIGLGTTRSGIDAIREFYQGVIERPAARLASTDSPLKIEPALTQTLLEDIERGGGKDALPLLAFTLEWLFLEYGGDGELTLEAYQELGGIEGAIEEAVESDLELAIKDPRLPSQRSALIPILRRGLIPWLAGIDPKTQSPHRRIAGRYP